MITSNRTILHSKFYNSVFKSVHGSIGQSYSSKLKDYLKLYPNSADGYMVVKFKKLTCEPDRLKELLDAQNNGSKIIIQTAGRTETWDAWDHNNLIMIIDYLKSKGVKVYGACLGNEPEAKKRNLTPESFSLEVNRFHFKLRTKHPEIKHVFGSFASLISGYYPSEILAKRFPEVARDIDIYMFHLYQVNPKITYNNSIFYKLRKLGFTKCKFFNGESSISFVNNPPKKPRVAENIRACYELQNNLEAAAAIIKMATFNIQDEDWQKSKLIPGTKNQYYTDGEKHYYDAEGMYERGGNPRLTALVHENILSKIRGDLTFINIIKKSPLIDAADEASLCRNPFLTLAYYKPLSLSNLISAKEYKLIVVNNTPIDEEAQLDAIENLANGLHFHRSEGAYEDWEVVSEDEITERKEKLQVSIDQSKNGFTFNIPFIITNIEGIPGVTSPYTIQKNGYNHSFTLHVPPHSIGVVTVRKY